MGESIFAFDVKTGAIEVAVPPFSGEADDLVFTPDGEMIWTGLLEGVVRIRRKDGSIQDLALDIPSVNSIALSRDKARLFVGQVFWPRACGRSTSLAPSRRARGPHIKEIVAHPARQFPRLVLRRLFRPVTGRTAFVMRPRI